MPQTEMTDAEIKALATEALDEAARYIQEKLGVKYGDVAGLFFSFDEDDERSVEYQFRQYIRTELAYMDENEEAGQ